MFNTNQLIQAKLKETIMMSLINLLSAVDFVTCARPNLTHVRQIMWQTEKMATGNRCAVRMGPRFTGHGRQVAA